MFFIFFFWKSDINNKLKVDSDLRVNCFCLQLIKRIQQKRSTRSDMNIQDTG